MSIQEALTWLHATCCDSRFGNRNKAIEYGKKACELSDWKDVNDLGKLTCAYAEAV